MILDNCEHVLDGVAELARRVTGSCPTVALLATSREPVGVAAERVWTVPSLDAAAKAVELFCDRAAAADADFSPTEADHAVIAAICGRLDGIPLAIELASGSASGVPAAADWIPRGRRRRRWLREVGVRRRSAPYG